MSTGTNKQRITQNNGIINDDNADLLALKLRINNLPSTTDATATASDIANGKTAYANGVKITGNVPTGSPVMSTTYPSSSVETYLGDLMVNATQNTTNQFFNVGDKLSILADASDVATAAGLTANILKKDEVVLGVTGTYEGGSGIDWSAIGYSDEPSIIQDGYDHAKDIYDNWTPKVDCANEFVDDINLIFAPLIDTSIAEDMSGMFESCYSLTSIPLLNTHNAGDMHDMFNSCFALKAIPLLDTSAVTNMRNMFCDCYSLKTIPLLDTGVVLNMQGMFNGCLNLTSIPLLDTSAVTNMSNMFSNCYVLTSVPQLNTSNVTDMYGMFNQCYELETVPQLNTDNVTRMLNMFSACSSLSNQSLNNILLMCANSAVTTNKTLKAIGLSQTQAATCETLSNWIDCAEAGWRNRLLVLQSQKFMIE